MQELDSTIDQLGHRLAHLPETRELEALSAERTEVWDRSRDARIRVDDLTREQKKADADVEQVKGRRTRDRDRMDSGQITNPKDLARMQQELVSLDRRISDLEDEELEVMAHLEDAQTEHAQLATRVAELDERIAGLTETRDAAAGETTTQREASTAEREVVAAGVPQDLLGLYERVRAQKGGVGAAALRQRRCEGCSLQLNAADLGVIAKAPTDEVLRCEECNRILVRTPESGI